jgi:hypothetical protein
MFEVGIAGLAEDVRAVARKRHWLLACGVTLPENTDI